MPLLNTLNIQSPSPTRFTKEAGSRSQLGKYVLPFDRDDRSSGESHALLFENLLLRACILYLLDAGPQEKTEDENKKCKNERVNPTLCTRD